MEDPLSQDEQQRLTALQDRLSTADDYRDLFENASDIIYTHDLEGVLTSFNKAAERLTGYTREEALRMNILNWLEPESRALTLEMMRRELGGAPRAAYEVTLLAKDGRKVALEVGSRLVFRRGRPIAMQGIARDVTERKQAEILELDRNRVLELVAGNEPLENVLEELCRLVERQLNGVSCSIALGSADSAAVVAPAGVSEGPADGAACPGSEGPGQFPILARDGQVLGSFRLHPGPREESVRDRAVIETARRLAVVAIEQRALTDQLAYQALHDALTGLPNRFLLEQQIDRMLAEARRHNWLVAVLFIDLDLFKQINDTLGHTAGDKVLEQVARRLEGCLRKSDCLARMGGDEFTVVLPELADSRDAQCVAEKLLTAFQEPFLIEGHELFRTASIGISLCPRDGNDAAILQRKADSAMYRAKNRGRNGFEFFAPELDVAGPERLEIESALRRAMDNGELQIYYQPQVDSSGRLAAFEALLVWNHPKLGPTSPARFIPVAEESGMIVPIGSWVIAESCRQNAAWQLSGCPPIRIAVNVSATQFCRMEFVDTVAQAISSSGLDPSLLELELTEGVIVRDLEESARQMDRLRALGVGISIDDFGTGYSSLSYLRRLPIDALKIDQSFLREVEKDPNTLPLVKAIVALAHGLSLKVVAEGIESQYQLDALRSIGCDFFQGYLCGEPLPASAAGQMLCGVRLSNRVE